MLTQQHRFANQILHPQRQRAYKVHMCGLCHALGDNYGLPFRTPDINPCDHGDTSCHISPFGNPRSWLDSSCLDCSGENSSSQGDICFGCGYLDCGNSSTDSSTSRRRKKKQPHETPPDQPHLD